MKFVLEFQPVGRRQSFAGPLTIMEAAQRAGIRLKSICNGKGECGKCKVKVKGASLPPLDEIERKLLLADEIDEGYRLACRTEVAASAEVYLPPASLEDKQRLQIAGVTRRIRIDPPVCKHLVEVPPPTLQDTRSDFQRIQDALKEQDVAVETIDLEALRLLNSALTKGAGKVTGTTKDGEIIAVDPGDSSARALGLAIDLGTTKIALYLVDLRTGKILDALGVMNPQIAYGEDVITRIQAALEDEVTRQRLSEIVVDEINQALAELLARNQAKPEEVVDVSLVGNTAMHHLFLRLPTRQLALAPYVLAANLPLEIKARPFGLQVSTGSYIHLVPPVAGFVGSDHVAMILASGLEERPGKVIGVDIGTNTEIALKTEKGLSSCSCASGPAFEGAHIRHGMRAAPGAIEGVHLEGQTLKVAVETIENRKPVGLCGSGILDAIAEMVRVGLIDSSGRLVKDRAGVRLSPDSQQMEFVLVPREETALEGDIVITQKDIREIQLAKAAIRTGFEILLQEASLAPQDVAQVIIAGAFGSHLDPASALRIGMFPDIPLNRFVQVGNAAGIGATQVLISRRLRRKAAALARRIRYVELAARPDFSEHFTRWLALGPPQPLTQK